MPAAPLSQSVRNGGDGRKPPATLLDALRGVRRPIVAGHVTPDADCLGSMLGLTALLRAHGAAAEAVLPPPGTAQRLQFMLQLAGPVAPVRGDVPADADAVIVVDTATAKRVNVPGAFDAVSGLTSFNIDHHITNPDYAAHNWVDPHASSTSELVARLAWALQWEIPPAIASLLYAGLHGDTAGFSLPNTTADALRTASALLQAGADVAHVGEQLCRSQGRPDFELLRRVYDHTRTSADGRIAWSHLTHGDITAAGCTAADIDDQVAIPRALRGIQIAMLFTEGEPGIIRVNLRGEGRTSVLEIAERFGGGGHVQSAGVRVRNKRMESVIEEFLAAALAHLDQSGSGVGS